ncbi:MAG: DUF4249 domain-containing protein [Imperialibacter sp.]|uniref:DUF4249 domain-containing protein n=1 Tax=Imperialibacter sp. TaxID=2038411 RepID=UPI0032F05E0E
MKSANIYIVAALLVSSLFACEDVIYPELADSEPVVSIDAFVTSQDKVQVIKVTKTQYYFDKNRPAGVSGAEVSITDDQGRVFLFTESNTDGWYEWNPSQSDDSLGLPGVQYSLSVLTEGIEYTSSSVTQGVPKIDSITFNFEPENDFALATWFAEVWARDLDGPGNAYWIKGWKNGKYLNKPAEILTAYDAGFSRGSEVDGLIFITPVRSGTGINLSTDEDPDTGKFLPSYLDGDSIYVEIHAVSEATFDFLNLMKIQIDRPGGFGELFATPIDNVPTNIIPSQEGVKVVGCFNVSTVSSFGKKLVAENETP